MVGGVAQDEMKDRGEIVLAKKVVEYV